MYFIRPRTMCAVAVLAALCFTATACGGGGSTGTQPSSSPPVAPSIAVQPSSQGVTAPATATFTVSATGTAPLVYQWSKNGVAIAGATSSNYTTPPTAGADSDSVFTVTVTNSAGSLTSAPATLTVNLAPAISAQPQSQTVTAPGVASFAVEASGTGTLSYLWARNGVPIANATTPTYTTPSTTVDDNGAAYSVTVTNAYGSATSNAAILTVEPAPDQNLSGPVLVGGRPWNQWVTAGASATFTATAIGSGPISYQWSRNGEPIAGANSATYTTPPASSADDGSSFAVTVSNAVGSLTSSPAILTVTAAAVAPQLASQPQNTTTGPGTTASFLVFATGTAPLSYQWFRNGSLIPGATNASYTTPPVTAADDKAEFTVAVTDSAGSVTSAPGTLFVNHALVGLTGFRLLGTGYPLPFAPGDIIGVRYQFEVVTNQVAGSDIIFGFNGLTTPGSPIGGYELESNIYTSLDQYANGGCTTFPPLGASTPGEASLRNATADYPFNAGSTTAVASAINTSDPINWPVQTYLVDNIPKLWKSDSMSQFNINGLAVTVTVQRGGTITDVSAFERCGLAMAAATYRVWTVTAQAAGQPAVVNQIVVPDADAQFIVPAEAMQFASEFLAQPGTLTVQYWDFAYLRASDPEWIPASEFMTNPIYDGDGHDFGLSIVTVNGQDRIEISNLPGSYLTGGNLPFFIHP